MKAILKGTQTNNMYVYADGRKVGRMDYDHKRLYIFEWFDWIDQEELVHALIEYEFSRGSDLAEVEAYWQDVIIEVEEL